MELQVIKYVLAKYDIKFRQQCLPNALILCIKGYEI